MGFTELCSQPLSPTLMHSEPLSPTPSHSHPLQVTLTHFQRLPANLTQSHPVSPTPSNSHTLPTTASHSHPLPSTFQEKQPTPTRFSRKTTHSHPFFDKNDTLPPNFQEKWLTPTHFFNKSVPLPANSDRKRPPSDQVLTKTTQFHPFFNNFGRLHFSINSNHSHLFFNKNDPLPPFSYFCPPIIHQSNLHSPGFQL